MKVKDRFSLWLRRKVFKVPEGAEMPPLCAAIHYLLYPLEALGELLYRRGSVRLDILTQTVIVGRMRFTREYLMDLWDAKNDPKPRCPICGVPDSIRRSYEHTA